jgi:hypothetical protein
MSSVTRLIKKTMFSMLMLAVVGLSFASIGGGGNKAKKNNIKGDFTPIRTTNGFTLKAGPVYNGSMSFGQQRTANVLSFNSLITYQKGNATYILPYRYKLPNIPQEHNSLQMLNLHLPMHK